MKTAALMLLLATGVYGDENEFVTYSLSQKEKCTVSINTTPLAREPAKRMLPPFINLIGKGMVAYAGEKQDVNIEARIMGHTEYWVVNEQEGNKKLTDWLLKSLDEKIAPIFTSLAKQVVVESERQKAEYLSRAKQIFGDKVNTEFWFLPTGYALAEEIRITIPKNPMRAMLLYHQNLGGNSYMREKVLLLQDEYSICIAQQKKIAEAMNHYSIKYGKRYKITGESDDEYYMGLLKRVGMLEQNVKEYFGGRYFMDLEGNVWCSKHIPPTITPDIIKKKCAEQQDLLSGYMMIYYYTNSYRYPDLSNPKEFMELDDKVILRGVQYEPANSAYLSDNKGNVWCAVHGKLY